MKDITYSTFPKGEYKERNNKLKELMQEKNLDAILLTNKANTVYFAGYPAIHPGEGAVIIPLEGEPTLIHSVTETGNAERTTWFNDLRHYQLEDCPWAGPGVPRDSLEIINSRIKELGIQNPKIGMEPGFEGFKRRLEDIEIIDASDLFWKLRSIKSKAEIKVLKKVAQETCRAEMTSFAELRPGITEREFLKIVLLNLVKESGGFPPDFALTRTGAQNCRMINSTGSDKPIKKGELILLDGGARYHEYPADVLRMAIIGQPTDKQRRMVDIELEAEKACIDIIRPGIKAKDIFNAGKAVFEKSGIKKGSYLGYSGHGIGIDGYNPPILNAINETIIEEGMVLCVEPQCWDAPYMNNPQIDVVVEDTIVVTKNGFEYLTDPETIPLYIKSGY